MNSVLMKNLLKLYEYNKRKYKFVFIDNFLRGFIILKVKICIYIYIIINYNIW